MTSKDVISLISRSVVRTYFDWIDKIMQSHTSDYLALSTNPRRSGFPGENNFKRYNDIMVKTKTSLQLRP